MGMRSREYNKSRKRKFFLLLSFCLENTIFKVMKMNGKVEIYVNMRSANDYCVSKRSVDILIVPYL